jgi:hypothetical protein
VPETDLSALIVVLASDSATTRLFSVIALVFSMLSFWWLFPAIRKMVDAGWIAPGGYSPTLGVMIACFVGGFAAALVLYLALNAGA